MKRHWGKCVLILTALWLICGILPSAMAETGIAGFNAEIELPGNDASIEIPGALTGDIGMDIEPPVLALDGMEGEGLETDVPALTQDGNVVPDAPADARNGDIQANEYSDFIIDTQGVLTKYTGAGGSVTIPETVTAIGDSAFRDCGTVTDVYVPGNVKDIGDSAFRGCTGLNSVDMMAGVETIGEYAFYDCENLRNVTMGDGLKTIKNYAFFFSPIEELFFPDSVTDLAFYATQDSGYNDSRLAKNLKRVHWPAGVEEVHNDQFSSFTALEWVEIPEGVNAIGGRAFSGCENLRDISMFEGITDIGSSAFSGCKKLENIPIPATVTAIGDSAFFDCDNLTDVFVPGNVKTIGDSAFRNCDSLFSVNLVSGVETIGSDAFSSCGSLKNLTMGDGLKTVKSCAFVSSPIEELIFPDSVTELSSTATQDSYYSDSRLAKNLKKVHWPAGVKEVHGGQFRNFSTLTDAEIPKGVTSIGENAFSNCQNLKNVDIASSVKTISDSSFNDCPKVEFTTPVGSNAEKYAEEKDIPVNGTDEEGHAIEPEQVKLNKTKATLVVGGTLKLKATTKPANVTRNFTWTSSNKKVATVTKKGVVKALKKGTAVITVRTANGKKATCRITVPAAPTGVTLNKTRATLTVGKKLTLKPKLKGAGARTTYTWKSSNKKIATVSNKGVVKALKKGTVVITVRTANGKKATCKITVK